MAKKKVSTPKKVKVKEVNEEIEDPNSFQTIKGIKYPRPTYFGIGANGNLGFHYDVDGYPDEE